MAFHPKVLQIGIHVDLTIIAIYQANCRRGVVYTVNSLI